MAHSTVYFKDYRTILQSRPCRICSVNGRLSVSGFGGCTSSQCGFIGVMSDMGVLGLRLREWSTWVEGRLGCGSFWKLNVAFLTGSLDMFVLLGCTVNMKS